MNNGYVRITFLSYKLMFGLLNGFDLYWKCRLGNGQDWNTCLDLNPVRLLNCHCVFFWFSICRDIPTASNQELEELEIEWI
jgi:hypothetical protein